MECVICLDPVSRLPDERPQETTCVVCNATTHDDCTRKWAIRSPTCPICRTTRPSVAVVVVVPASGTYRYLAYVCLGSLVVYASSFGVIYDTTENPWLAIGVAAAVTLIVINGVYRAVRLWNGAYG